MKINRIKRCIPIILIILISLLIVVGIISYNKYNNNNNKDDNKNQKDNYEVLDINDSLTKNLFSLTRSKGNSLFLNTEYENIYYNKIGVDIKNVDINFKLLLSYENLDASKFKINGEKTIIDEEDLKEQYNKIFGDNSYTSSDILYSCPSIIEYNKDKKQYEYSSACGRAYNKGYKNKLIESRKYKDRIEIFEKAVFYIISPDLNRITYLKNGDYTDEIVALYLDEEFKIDDYLVQLNTYKYTFRYNEGNYYFEKVEMVK